MTFVNWGMLFGLVALLVPILIHLLNRSRAQMHDWGAMRFLLASLTSQNRRILVEEIILLVLRCLLVALVVLAMARPFLPSRYSIPWAVVLPAFLAGVICLGVAGAMWANRKARWALLAAALALAALAGGASVNEKIVQQIRWAAGKGETDVALIIDASLSMTVKTEGRTNFDRAIAEARTMVAACEPGDAVSIILAGPVPRAVIASPTADRQEIATALEGLAPVGSTMGVLEALNVAAASLAGGDNAAKKIVLITDGQNVGWDVRSSARWRFLAEGLKELPAPPKVICRILPLPTSFRNVAVADVDFSRKVVGADRPVRIHVKVMNTGTVTVKPQAVELSIDGAKVTTEKFVTEILPKATETITFEHRFKRPGPRLVSARVLMPDDIPQDNHGARVLDVIDRLNVLIVDGTPSPLPLAGAGDFVDIALTPTSAEPDPPPATEDGDEPAPPKDEMDFLVVPRVVPAPDIAKVGNFRNYAAIILANVPRLPDAVARRLIEFVQAGGGLLIAPGSRAKPTFYHAWATRAAEPVAPARLAERRVAADDPARLAAKTFSHPALRLLADTKQSDANVALVKHYWKLVADEKDPAVRIGGRLQTGEPFLVERKLGKGYVLMLATALDPASSNLPTLKSFVPLVHELVYYLASPMMLDPNVAPGAEVTLELRGASHGST
ncbi:VWA domain-containing protein, partial [bacterium]|nr:VWA domain-containing protein [bacterium]